MSLTHLDYAENIRLGCVGISLANEPKSEKQYELLAKVEPLFADDPESYRLIYTASTTDDPHVRIAAGKDLWDKSMRMMKEIVQKLGKAGDFIWKKFVQLIKFTTGKTLQGLKALVSQSGPTYAAIAIICFLLASCIALASAIPVSLIVGAATAGGVSSVMAVEGIVLLAKFTILVFAVLGIPGIPATLGVAVRSIQFFLKQARAFFGWTSRGIAKIKSKRENDDQKSPEEQLLEKTFKKEVQKKAKLVAKLGQNALKDVKGSLKAA
jgi:hypothetical protein